MMGMGFANPDYVGFFAGLIVIAFLMLQTSKIRRQVLGYLGLKGSDLLSVKPQWRRIKTLLWFIGAIFAILSLMGPQWGQKMHTVRAQGLDICFAMDLSKSMLAEDASPSRLALAKNQLSLFLPNLGGDRAALVGFAGDAYVAAPLSVDHQSLTDFLDPMNPEFVSNPSTNLSRAVDVCLSTLKADKALNADEILDDAAKLIVLISDGEDTVKDGTGAVARAEKLGIPIYAMAVGTIQGGPMPLRDDRGEIRGYVMDGNTGKAAISKLEDKGLLEIAEKTGGKVYYASEGLGAWQKFEKAIATYKRDSRDAGTRLSREDRFQIPLLIAFILLFVEFVVPESGFMKKLALLLFTLMSVGTEKSYGAGLGFSEWKANREGIESFSKGKFPNAREHFEKGLAENSSEGILRYNWATSQMFAALGESSANKESSKEDKAINIQKLAEARKEFERLLEVAKEPCLKKIIEHQIAQTYHLSSMGVDALKYYYQSLETKVPDSGACKDLDRKTRNNIAKLIQQMESGSSQGQGDGKGKEGDQESKDGQGNKDDKNQNKLTRGGDHKPKFNGKDVSEGEAKQILESVNSEEKDVQKKKARFDAQKNQKGQRYNRSGKEGDSGVNGKPW